MRICVAVVSGRELPRFSERPGMTPPESASEQYDETSRASNPIIRSIPLSRRPPNPTGLPGGTPGVRVGSGRLCLGNGTGTLRRNATSSTDSSAASTTASAQASSIPKPQRSTSHKPSRLDTLNASDVSIRFTEHLALEGIAPSIGTVGDAYGNGLMETIIGLFKTECITTSLFHKGPYKTLADVGYATAGWVDWYNHRRRHGCLGMVPPAEYEHAHYAAHIPQEQPV